jgi:DNA-binding NarL/FixJ family response regulator
MRQMAVEESVQIKPRVLTLSTDELVRGNVRVLLGSMGYQCLVASSLEEALALQEQERPDAAILDPHEADSPAAWTVATFFHKVPRLRGQSIVLVRDQTDPELLRVLEAYSVASVRVDGLVQELWPTLDSLLQRTVMPQQVTNNAPLVFDSFLEQPPAGTRSWQATTRQLLYESGPLVADVSLEAQEDSQHMALAGQVLDRSRPKPQLSSIPVVLQGRTGLVGISKTNEWGEFRFEFDFEPGLTLEMQARTKHWVSFNLPDLKTGKAGSRKSR